MRTSWPSLTVTPSLNGGFARFSDDTQDAENAQQNAQDAVNAGTITDSSSALDGAATAVTGFLGNLWGTIGAPLAKTAIQNTINSGIYGTPSGYITSNGLQVPYWLDSTGKNAFTLNPNGDKVPLPTGGASNSAAAALAAAKKTGGLPTWAWIAIGGGALVVLLAVMKK